MANNKSFTRRTKPHIWVSRVSFSPPSNVVNEISIVICHETAYLR